VESTLFLDNKPNNKRIVMKKDRILGTVAAVILTALTSFGQASEQTTTAGGTQLTQPPTKPPAVGNPGLGAIFDQKENGLALQANTPIPTASEVLAKIIADSEQAKTPIPLDIYPPHYLDRLKEMGDQPAYTREQFDRGASALKAGDKANMVLVDPTFLMGSPSSEAERHSNEGPQHTVVLTYSYYISQYEVTQGEYQQVMGSNPSRFTTTDYNGNPIPADLNRPVERVSWNDATAYCSALTTQAHTDGTIPAGWIYRLPTEAEWECSARAGTTTAFSFGTTIHGGMANFVDTVEYDSTIGSYGVTPTIAPLPRTTTVGSYMVNPFGFYDFEGNVAEWCCDYYDTYPSGTVIDPMGPTSGSTHVIRGGDWGDTGFFCRSAYRLSDPPTFSDVNLGFRVVLVPTTPEWKTAVTTTPTQPTYGSLPAKGSGKDSLVFITHGNIPWVDSPSSDTAWVDAAATDVQTYLSSHSLNNWQVDAYKWIDKANQLDLLSRVDPVYAADKSVSNAKMEGKAVGDNIVLQGWTHVHLVAHSAGAALIQAASERIKELSPGTVVHTTFLDPFVGSDFAGVANYGNGADWADNYFTRDLLTGGDMWQLTETPLNHAYNVEVTPLDPSKIGSTKFNSSASGLMGPCYKTVSSHGWPIDFYQHSITNEPSDYDGFGFPLSEEGGNWSYALTHYTPGNTPAQLLGTPDPTCTTDIQVTPPSYINTVPDFTQLPTLQSDTGTIQKYIDHLNLLTGSPAWLATVVTSTNPVNLLSFDAEFTSSTAAQGLLTVLWDAATIGTVDERIISSGIQHYEFRFQNAPANSTHVLGFRLDPFTNIQSTITLTNVVLNQVGVSQPFSLAITTNIVGGSSVYQLTGEAGFTYGIQASTNLIDWTLITSLGNTNGTVLFYDQDSTNYSTRFYRGVAPY
jgi:formylglycine-generating enzyme required for sulfatase activity